MKELLEDLIKTYKRRVKDLDEMSLITNTDSDRVRMITKRNVYKTVIMDLEDLIREEDD